MAGLEDARFAAGAAAGLAAADAGAGAGPDAGVVSRAAAGVVEVLAGVEEVNVAAGVACCGVDEDEEMLDLD